MAAAGALDVVFLLGADEIDIAPGAFVVYQGSHGDRGAHRADVILPGAAYTEKNGTYVSTEGRVQRARRAVFPPGEAAEDWAILRALSDRLGHTLPFDRLDELRAAMTRAVPHLGDPDAIAPGDPAAVEALARAGGTPSADPFAPAIADFYLTNPIARASRTMAESSALRRGPAARTGTHG
jgi:NADH-quinone oxidoreductase subunit G